MTERTTSTQTSRVIFVTGASGAGRSTAINALEDLGYEAIDNLPLSLIERVLDGGQTVVPLAVGIDVRNRDFSVDGMVAMLDTVSSSPETHAELLYLDCRPDVLIQRYSETRRRHPLAPSETPDIGIAREMELLQTIRERADYLIDTSDMSPHDLRAEIERLLTSGDGPRLAVSVESFSYKRGLPRGIDLIFDVRFLANPHWEPTLRGKDGRDPGVADYVSKDPRFGEFFERLSQLILFLLPAYRDEGKTHLSIGLGCTGGQHRSVAVAELLANFLADAGWQVSTRHREMERRGRGPASLDMGTSG